MEKNTSTQQQGLKSEDIEAEIGPGFEVEQRVKPNYKYRRCHQTNYGCYILSITATTFGNIRIPDNQQGFFKKLFSTEGEGKKLQPLYQARPNDICAAISVTKSNNVPTQLEPLEFPPNTNKTVQYLLLDEKGFEEFIKFLPYFKEKVIPWMESEMDGDAAIKNPSPYSSVTMTKQTRIHRKLQEYQDIWLDMSAIPFETGTSLELRYKTKGSGEARAGAFFGASLIDYLMDERDAMEQTLRDLKRASPWCNVVADDLAESEGMVCKRMRVQQDTQELE